MHDLLDPGTKVFWISPDGLRHHGVIVQNYSGGNMVREDGEIYPRLMPYGHCTEDKHVKKK